MNKSSTVNNTFLNDIKNIKPLYEELKTKIENLQKNHVITFCQENQPRNEFDDKNKKNFEELTTKMIIESKVNIQAVIDTIVRDTNYYIYQALIDEITTQNLPIIDLITSFLSTSNQTNAHKCNSIISTKVNKIILEPINNYLKRNK